jgi:predicted Zn-dependent peptidase
VPTEELERARNHLSGHLLLSLESSESRMTRLAKTELHFGRDIPVEELLEAFGNVTTEDIQTLANDLFDDSSLSLALIGRVAEIPLGTDRVTLS